MFPSFNFSIFTEDDDTSSNNEDRKENAKFTQFCNLYRALKEKSAFLKIAAEAFEAGDFFNIFLMKASINFNKFSSQRISYIFFTVNASWTQFYIITV